jgi:hypothetical protein
MTGGVFIRALAERDKAEPPAQAGGLRRRDGDMDYVLARLGWGMRILSSSGSKRKVLWSSMRARTTRDSCCGSDQSTVTSIV